MSRPACEPFAVYPISINFAEAASIGCNHMNIRIEMPAQRDISPCLHRKLRLRIVLAS
jgi:hypothetical protein